MSNMLIKSGVLKQLVFPIAILLSFPFLIQSISPPNQLERPHWQVGVCEGDTCGGEGFNRCVESIQSALHRIHDQFQIS
jgi:hypothetical protein